MGDHSLNDFHFSPDYHVDEILFRHILGTVTNADLLQAADRVLVRSGAHAARSA